MQKTILGLVLLASSFCFAQLEEVPSEKKITGALSSRVDDLATIGANFEFPRKKKGDFVEHESTVAYIATPVRSDWNGFVLGVGTKYYLNKKKNYGWNIQNAVEYTQYSFSSNNHSPEIHTFATAVSPDPPNLAGADYSGTYKYISLVNPQAGYKFKVGNFAIEPSIGFMWKMEIKGQGDVDNKTFSNTIGKFGLNAGYIF